MNPANLASLCGCRGCSPRRPRAPRHSSEGWNPACATAERTRGGGAHTSFPRRHEPRIPAPCLDVGAVRERPLTSCHPNVPPKPTTTAYCATAAPALTLFAYVAPVQTGNLASRPLSGCRGRSRTALTSCHPQRTLNPQPNDNCPLRRRRASLYIGHRSRLSESTRHSSEGWNDGCATAERTRGGRAEGL